MKINNPFKWLKEKVRKVLNMVDSTLYENIDEAITIANTVKRLVSLPVTTIIVTVTPNEFDNKLATILNKTMDEVLMVLKLAEQCQEKENYQQRLRCFVEQLRLANPELQAAIYLKLASLFLHKRTNGEVPVSTCDTLVQVKYWENKNAFA